MEFALTAVSLGIGVNVIKRMTPLLNVQCPYSKCRQWFQTKDKRKKCCCKSHSGKHRRESKRIYSRKCRYRKCRQTFTPSSKRQKCCTQRCAAKHWKDQFKKKFGVYATTLTAQIMKEKAASYQEVYCKVCGASFLVANCNAAKAVACNEDCYRVHRRMTRKDVDAQRRMSRKGLFQ